MGLGLRACFVAAGLAEPELHAGRLIGGGSSFGGYRFLSEIIRSVVPEIERSGLATPDELDVDTLEERLRDATCTTDATVALPTIVTAWSQLDVGTTPD